jgi:predicted nucleotidyltransferase
MKADLDKIREAVLDVLLPYGVEEVALFGSRVRNDARPDSDLDILVRFEEPPRLPLGFFAWIELEEKLSMRCGHKVDLVPERALKKHIRPYIEQDKVVIYEAH